MAAFSSSFQHLDASSSSSSLVFLQNPNSSSSSTSINNMCALFHHPNNALLSHNFHQHSNNTTTTIIINEVKNDTGSSSPINTAAPNKNSMDSSVSQFTPKNNLLLLPLNKKKRKSNPPSSSSSPNSAQSKDMREVKGKKQKKVKECKEKKGGEEETPKDYIHVRARRGQATDSHSLAERVRRERISERMKLLQALVPGCDKVTGKALMLDEIINYVQSLQNQVEFLSMKLASINPIFYNFGMDMEPFMVGPDQNLVMQECSPTASNAYQGLENNNNNNNNNSVNSLLFHQFQIPNALPQGDRQALWEVDEKIINQSEISNLFSFPLM